MEEIVLDKRDIINSVINASTRDISKCDDLGLLRLWMVNIQAVIDLIKKNLRESENSDSEWRMKQENRRKFHCMFLTKIQHRVFVVKTNNKINDLIQENCFWKNKFQLYDLTLFNECRSELKQNREKINSVQFFNQTK